MTEEPDREYCPKNCPYLLDENYFQGRCRFSKRWLPKTDAGKYHRDWNMASRYFPMCPDLK